MNQMQWQPIMTLIMTLSVRSETQFKVESSCQHPYHRVSNQTNLT